jgi:GT2 family glycosyltransferase
LQASAANGQGESLLHKPTRVSIIITNYNYEGYLRRSIDSALAQDHPEIEVVVVDDASTDNSRSVIEGYGQRLRSVLHERNAGHGAAFNSGFRASSGDIVMFLDADDYLYANAASTVAAAMGDAAQLQFRLDLVDAAGAVIDLYPPAEVAFDAGQLAPALLQQGRYSTTVTSGLAFSRKALDAVMPMNEEAFRQGADGYLVSVVPFHGSVLALDQVLGAYCQHGGNHSQFGQLAAKRARWRLAHDEHRYDAIRAEAQRLGQPASQELGSADPIHLEERIASLLLDPKSHPYVFDTRAELSRLGAASSDHLKVSSARRAALKAWWVLLGRLPRSLASTVLLWKIQAGSRPAIAQGAIRLVRRLAG